MVRITDIIGEDYRDWGRPKASIVYSATDTGDANHSQTEDPLANNTPETQRRKLKMLIILSSMRRQEVEKHISS